jgi:PKD repeat protein
MRKILLSLLGLAVLGINSCSENDFPVPSASTVSHFSYTIDNDEFAPATVTFINESVVPDRAGEVSYMWSFGDGESSFLESPTHLYDTPGAYVVNLVVLTTETNEIHEYSQTLVIQDPNASGVQVFFTTGATVFSALINDKQPIPVSIGIDGLNGAYGVAIDTVQDKLYIADFAGDKILVSNLDGSGQQTFRATIGKPTSVAIDYKNNLLYWDTAEGIRRGNLADLTTNQYEDFVTGQLSLDPEGIAIDTVNEMVYWNTYDGGVWRKTMSGTGQAEIIPGIGGGSIILVGDRIFYDTYIGTDNSQIRSANLDGTGVATVITSISDIVYGIAYDKFNNKIYWSDRGAAKTSRADLNGTNIQVWANTQARGLAIGKFKE